MSENARFYAELEEKRLAFEKDEHPPLSRPATERFKSMLASPPSSLSRGRQSIRVRASDIAMHIYRHDELGPDVLLLVVLVVKSYDGMLLLKQQGLISYLRSWWSTAHHPKSLADVTKTLTVEQESNKITGISQGLPAGTASAGPHAVTAFEQAVLLAAQCITNVQDREAWLASARGHVSLLERLSHNDPWARFTRMAQWPILTRLGSYLGDNLASGMQKSRKREAEESKCMRLTDAVRLLPPSEEHADFGLEIWQSSAHGESIAQQAKGMTSIEGWRAILGDFLYEAAMESRFRKSEIDMGISRTGVSRILSPDNREGIQDSTLRLLISYEKGHEIWRNTFPHPD